MNRAGQLAAVAGAAVAIVFVVVTGLLSVLAVVGLLQPNKQRHTAAVKVICSFIMR